MITTKKISDRHGVVSFGSFTFPFKVGRICVSFFVTPR